MEYSDKLGNLVTISDNLKETFPFLLTELKVESILLKESMMTSLTKLILFAGVIGKVSREMIKKPSSKRVICATNTILALFILFMMSPAIGDEYFCKTYDKKVLNYDGEGQIDTMIYTVGCTVIRPGQNIVKMNVDEVTDDTFRAIFESDVKHDPLGIRD
jgi:hypothetical protein